MNPSVLISVYNKDGLLPFVKTLIRNNYKILSTGGTAKFLKENGIQFTAVEDYTGYPEMMDGRVKTLHPKVHGGILARRELPEDLAALEKHGMDRIDMVVVNLYPFREKLREFKADGSLTRGSVDERMIEFIDIGGPTMIRAAAKNWKHVAVVTDPADYRRIGEEFDSSGKVSTSTRLELAFKVFQTMADYDGSVASYLSTFAEGNLERDASALTPFKSVALNEVTTLRYGENPHQQAGLYRPVGAAPSSWRCIQGKELSYNNLLDLYASLDLFLDVQSKHLGAHAAVIIKHSNPCGIAVADNALEAFTRARNCDPVSAFGGIIVVSGVVDDQIAEEIVSGFVEVVALESMTPGAAAIFAKKKNVRVIECDFEALRLAANSGWGSMTVRNSFGDFLIQTADRGLAEISASSLVVGKGVDSKLLMDLNLAWCAAKHVKSNAIILTRDLAVFGIGAGQMSRLDSARLAVERAKIHGHEVAGCVAASDAFLPFPDTLDVLAAAGIVALVQPGGSVKDEEVKARAAELGVSMYFTGQRHFRH
jgi:phosphoribosylaminoimidazolecarboxamide formyltransferase/IMP cyclohydrolase